MMAQPGSLSKSVAWLGLDIAKRTFDAGLWLSEQTGKQRTMRDIPVRSFPRTAEGSRRCIEWLDHLLSLSYPGQQPPAVHVVMEATGKYSMELAVWLLSVRPALAPAIINPQQAAAFIKSLALRNSTDKTTARALALYGAERQPAPYDPSTPLRAELRDLARYRQALVEMRVAETLRRQEGSSSALVQKLQQRHIEQIIDLRVNKETALCACYLTFCFMSP